MVVEGSWGLGEAVVSGQVQPDRVQLDRETGAIKDYTVSTKEHWIRPGTHAAESVPAELRDVRCLSDTHLRDIRTLGLRSVDLFGGEQDIEWAWPGNTAAPGADNDKIFNPADKNLIAKRLIFCSAVKPNKKSVVKNSLPCQ